MVYRLWILLLLAYLINAQQACQNAINPSGPGTTSGSCLNIHSCPQVLNLLTSERPLKPDTIKKLQTTQCGFEGTTPKVCCASENRPPVRPPQPPVNVAPTTAPQTPPPPTPTKPLTPRPPNVNQAPVRIGVNNPKLRLLPIETCGVSDQDRIVNGKKAGLKQFPWMARLGYVTRSGESYRCGGSLISKRYVLTAAHCMSNLPANFKLSSVQLGEWDANTETDCELQNGGGQLCNPPPQKYNVEKAIPHPQYSPTALHHDIGLIRLDRDVDLAPDSVNTICLPVGPIQLKNYNIKLTVAGWGTTENGTASNALLYANVPTVDNDRCKTVYQRQANIIASQICAGGDRQDSCDGDSGGPLMVGDIVHGQLSVRQVQIGIVSFGPVRCGSQGQPGVYTRTGHYLSWILDNMQP